MGGYVNNRGAATYRTCVLGVWQPEVMIVNAVNRYVQRRGPADALLRNHYIYSYLWYVM